MDSAPSLSALQPRRLARWAVMFPAAVLTWVVWQQLLAHLFYGGVFQAGLHWIEGTAEAAFVLVAALVAPARKRVVAAVAFGFFVCRDLATVLWAPAAGTPSDAVFAMAMAFIATAIVWWRTRRTTR